MSASTWPRWPTDKTVGSRWIVRLTVGEGLSCESLPLNYLYMAQSQTAKTVGAQVAQQANRRQMGFWAKKWIDLVDRLLDGLLGGLAEKTRRRKNARPLLGHVQTNRRPKNPPSRPPTALVCCPGLSLICGAQLSANASCVNFVCMNILTSFPVQSKKLCVFFSSVNFWTRPVAWS